MLPALLGKKVGMTRIIAENGVAEPVTVIQAGPCVALDVRTSEVHGYNAVQLGFGDVKPHRTTMGIIGHCGRAGTGPKRHIAEVRCDKPTPVTRGQVLTVEQFAAGVDYVDVTGVTKGKGFQGVMKRHGFGGMCASHGTERKHRSAGGIGGNAPRGTGQSVKKGKRMAGHMGNVKSTAGPLRLLKVVAERDLLLVRGSVPGAPGGLVLVRKAKKAR